jgi:hypothetical protein
MLTGPVEHTRASLKEANPIAQANRFWGAPTAIGFAPQCVPNKVLRKRGLTSTLGRSPKNFVTTSFVGAKFPLSHAYMKAIRASKNRMPARLSLRR